MNVLFYPQLIVFILAALLFRSSGALYYAALLQFLGSAFLYYDFLNGLTHRQLSLPRIAGLLTFQLIFIFYTAAIYGLSIASEPVTLGMLGQFYENFRHLRSSIANLVDIRIILFLLLSAVIGPIIFLFRRSTSLSRELPSAPRTSIARLCIAALLWTVSGAFVYQAKVADLEVGPVDKVELEVVKDADIARQTVGYFADKVPALKIRQPIVLIMVEALRRKSLPFFGYSRDTAPFLTTLAADSIFFTDHYSPSSTSLNAMYSILTGAYAVSIKTGEIPGHNLKSPVQTIAQVLKKYGYHTDFFISGDSNYGNRTSYMLNHGFDRIIDWNDFPGEKRTDSWKIRDDIILDRIVEELAVSKDPVFILTFLLGTHHPYTIPTGEKPEYATRLSGGQELDYQNRYDDCLRIVDRDLEKFFKKLRDLPAERRPLVLIMGDHGDTFGVARGDHSIMTMRVDNIYQEVVQVPLLIWDAGAPLKITERTSHTMVAPMILSFLQDGRESFRRRIAAKDYPWLKNTYLFLANQFAEHIYGVVNDQYKLIKYYSRNKGRDPLLFDLIADPGEKHNLAGTLPEKTKKLEKLLDTAIVYFSRANRNESNLTRGLGPNEAEPLRDRIVLSPPQGSGMTVTFSGEVEVDDRNFNSLKNVRFFWGDGTESNSFFPATHTYPAPGHYEIRAVAETINYDFETKIDVDILGSAEKERAPVLSPEK